MHLIYKDLSSLNGIGTLLALVTNSGKQGRAKE
jgi:hypothetical protein